MAQPTTQATGIERLLLTALAQRERTRISRPTREGYVDVRVSSAADVEQLGGSIIDESVADNTAKSIVLASSSVLGAAFISYRAKRGSRAEAGRLTIFSDGAGAWQLSEIRDTVSGQDCGLTFSAVGTPSTISLVITSDASGDATAFKARWFYVPA